MSVQPNYEAYSFTREKTFEKQTEVECKINAQSEIKSVLAVTGNVSSVGEELIGEELRYTGRVAFCIVYENTDGNICKTECGVEFSDKYDKATDVSRIRFVKYSVSNIETAFVNGGYSVRATVSAEIYTESVQRADVLSGGEDVLCDYSESEFDLPLECNKDILQIDEEFDLNYQIKDVLSHRVFAHLNKAQSGIGVINLEGTLFLSMTMLLNDEKNSIIKERKAIPFNLELQMSSAAPSLKAVARIQTSKCSFKIVVDEDKSLSTVVASIDLNAYGCVYDCKNINWVRDAYSAKNELDVKFQNITHDCVSSQFCLNERITGVSDYTQSEGSKIVTALGESVEGFNYNPETKNISGIVTATVIEQTIEGYNAKPATLPFEIPFEGNAGCNHKFDVSIENFNFRERGNIEFELNLHIYITEIQSVEYKVIGEVVVGNEKQQKTNAISVYIARGNDTLWDVCKELGVSGEFITELNPNVQFPLTANDRIVIYRNL